ncbi:MAG TPA: hypothetical protein H9902_07355 [Candidatus Stackebrandtia faecavium]|nr:hypothetical protein [Candidatus Stackebrandtia faecavium]
MDEPVRSALAVELRDIGSIQVGTHFLYRPEDLHLTIRSLEGYQDFIDPKVVDSYAKQVKTVVDDIPVMAVEVHGLGCSPSGIIACGYPDSNLQVLRRRLHDLAQCHGPLAVAGADVNRIRDIANVSLGVFKEEGVTEPGLAEIIAQASDKPYGIMAVRRLSLVRYHWRAGRLDMVELKSFELGDPGGANSHD